MKNNMTAENAYKKNSLVADVSYMIQLILLFVCIIVIATYSSNVTFSIAILCLVFTILIVTHFTSITLGLILNIVVIFGGFSYYLYQLMVNGQAVPTEIYFWMVLCPLMTIVSSSIFRNMQEMEKENKKLVKRIRHFSIVDDVTELKNLQAYEMEMPIYHKIASRYDLKLLLIVMEFRYADDMQRILGKENMQQTAIAISKEMARIFRKEDVVYIFSKEPYEWGVLLLTGESSEEILRERMEGKMDKIDLSDVLGKNAPKPEISIGMGFAGEEESALDLREKAKGRMQYDV